MLTHSTMLFFIQTCLVLTFLVTNFMRDDTVVTVDSSQQITTTTTAALTDDFWKKFGGLTVDKFIATTMVTMTRMFVDTCVTWPLRIRDESSISIAKFRSKLIAKMATTPSSATNATGGASAKALQWLRVVKRSVPSAAGHSTTASLATDGGKRLYVRFEALLDLFDRMSNIVNDGEGTAVAAMDKAANAVSGSSGGGNNNMIKCTDRQLARQWKEYKSDFKLCSDALTESQRENDGLVGGMSIEQFVIGTDTTFRGRDDDRFLFADGVCENDEDEVDLLNGDLARMYLFAVLSLARYAPVKCYGTDYASSDAPVEIDEPKETTLDDCDESLVVLLVHISSHLFRSKVTMRQTRALFDYILGLWRTHRGLVTLEQLSQIIFTLYHMFQR